jgi:hypothetical protein
MCDDSPSRTPPLLDKHHWRKEIPVGYTTTFEGRVEVTPPLNEAEATYLRDFNESRRMKRTKGPYFVGGSGWRGQGGDEDVLDANHAPDGQPGLWCQWVPSEDDAGLEWDQGEKFYDATAWMAYLVEHFLQPSAVASLDLAGSIQQDPRFAEFTFDHVANGFIEAEGEESGDLWAIKVVDNEVTEVAGKVVYEGTRE